ncbi:MAG: sulfur reduction protein DsrE [Parcubacteria group bacterium CG10_big_fil_rev_8_21_14_0_10_38_31]|nr:MAG: sulfur reduction protein DsrE [Parcubacteria group bacterium CG10_big_fil_rev_8_21_14_0_10_38_31]
MKLGIVIYTNDEEAVWNAFRLANFSLKKGDEVKIFLLAKGVEYESLPTDKFKIDEEAESFAQAGGNLYACGTCVKLRQKEGSNMCPISTMQDLYTIIEESDKIVTF